MPPTTHGAREAGIDVRGTATALTAAKTLEAETRIPSETIAMLRAWHAHAEETGDMRQLDDAIPKRGVLIVDEAGMTETRDLAFLAQLAAERDTPSSCSSATTTSSRRSAQAAYSVTSSTTWNPSASPNSPPTVAR